MRERLLVVLFLVGVPILVGVMVRYTTAPASSASTVPWIHQAVAHATHSGLKNVQCQRDGSRITCTATNGSAGYTIENGSLVGTEIVVRSP